MSNISQLLSLDIVSVILGVFVILFAFAAVLDLIAKISVYVGKPVKWVKKNNEDHETIMKVTETLEQLRKQQNTDRQQSIVHDHEIKHDLEEMSSLFYDKMIEDMRWRILDFASAISNGRKFNIESYDFIIKTYEQYEKVLQKRGLKNGLIDETIVYIKSVLQEKMRNGEFKNY